MSDQSTGRDDEAILLKTVSTPPNYLPKITMHVSFWDDFVEYFKTTMFPWTLGFLLGMPAGAFILFTVLVGFNPLGN